VLGGDLGEQAARRAERRAAARNHEAGATEPRGDRDDVEAGGATARHKHRTPRVDSLVDGDLLDGMHHLLGEDADDRGGGLFAI